jgi:N-succinyldiaminopimelate aminotransferase
MNPDLNLTQPYPFARLRKLLSGLQTPADKRHISLSIGEPKHATPQVVLDALTGNLGELAKYPATQGAPALREAVSGWLERRYGTKLDPDGEILPTCGSREALFSFVQALIDRTKNPLVGIPCPFYQIYEGATLLAGAEPKYIACLAENGFVPDLDSVTEAEWRRMQFFFVCSPSNPTGAVLSLDFWRKLFALSDKYGFVIGSDECYSEIYFDETKPPLGALEACRLLGRDGFKNLVVFSSLSKRSNVPGMRSGFVAGDRALLKPYLLYRTYQGCAMPGAHQAASIAAWNDEAHVIENRRLYREKFAAALPLISKTLDVQMPDASFYLWAKTPIDDEVFTQRLYAEEGITVLPGTYLSREFGGINPGKGYVRIALVATVDEVAEASERIARFRF